MTSRKNQPMINSSLTIQSRLRELEEQKQAIDREMSQINSHRKKTISQIVKTLLEVAELRDSYGITQKEITAEMDLIRSSVQENVRTLQGVPALDEVKLTNRQQELAPSPHSMMGVAQPYEGPQQNEQQQQTYASQQQRETRDHERDAVFQANVAQHQEQQSYTNQEQTHDNNYGHEQNRAPQEDFSQMGIAQPEHRQEDFSQMGVAQPEHRQEDFSQMGVAQPEYPQEDFSHMGVAQPEYPQEDFSHMGVAQPELTQHNDQRGVAEDSNNPFRRVEKN